MTKDEKHNMTRYEAMRHPDEPIANSAQKILMAATDLFAQDSFATVSIKEIAALSGVNSALISYYFGGKKNLYQEVLNTQSEVFLKLQDKVMKLDCNPLEKIRKYVESIAKLQEEHPFHIHLVYRELLSPQPMFEGYVKSRLYLVHQFLGDLIEQGIKDKLIRPEVVPNHTAFTIEGIVMFYFLTESQIPKLLNKPDDKELDYLFQTLDAYLDSLKIK